MEKDRKQGEGEQEHNTKVTGWYRCSCGKAFSNKREIDPPDAFDNGIRYYFEGGSVFYPAYGNAVAQCWECAEGD